MKYLAEILSNDRVIARKATDAIQPKESLRHVASKMVSQGKKPLFASAYILNEEGSAWVYQLKLRHDGKYEVVNSDKKLFSVSRNVVIGVFAGNTRIKDVI